MSIKSDVMGETAMGYYHWVKLSQGQYQDCIRYSVALDKDTGEFIPYSVSSDSGEVTEYPELSAHLREDAAENIITWGGLG